MEKHDEQFTPKTVDEQVDELLQSQLATSLDLQMAHGLSQLYKENPGSLELVWQRLGLDAYMPFSDAVQQMNTSQEQMISQTEMARKERKAMEKDTSSWGMNPHAHLGESKKRRSPVLRGVGIGLIAAVALITIVSFTIFSGLLRPASQTTSNISTTGAHNQQQQPQLQKVISSGKQVCSLNAGSKVSINGAPWSADLSWSAQGQLVVGTYSSFKAYSAKNCSPIKSFQPAIQQQPVGPLWSPDGNKLLVADPGDFNSTYVLDRNGNILTKLQGDYIGSGRWSSDSTKIIFPLNDAYSYPTNHAAAYSNSQLQKFKISIRAIDVNNGKVTTLTQLPEGYGAYAWTSDAKTVVIRRLKNDRTTIDLATWDTNQGKLVSQTSLPEPASGQALSPDGSLLALDGEDKIDIYSTATWKLLASFADKKGPNMGASLAWSPNGNYLAEVSQSIKIYDVAANKLAATFGQVDAQHTITDLVWSPDGTGLATSTMVLSNDKPSDLTVNVWALS
jgi:hypothetical protein